MIGGMRMAGFFRTVRTVIACFLLLACAVFMYPLLTRMEGWRLALLLVVTTALAAGLLLRGVFRDRKKAAHAVADEREVAMLRLAFAQGGTLNATLAATRLGWPMETALATLRAVEDGSRVTSTVTHDGVLVFEFRELIHDPALPPPHGDAALSAPEEERAS